MGLDMKPDREWYLSEIQRRKEDRDLTLTQMTEHRTECENCMDEKPCAPRQRLARQLNETRFDIRNLCYRYQKDCP